MSPVSAQLLDYAALATLGGLSTAVLVSTNSLRMAFAWSRPWFPFLASLALSAFVAWRVTHSLALDGIVLALLNGCLIFITAMGGNELGRRAASQDGGESAGREPMGVTQRDRSRGRFFAPW